MSTMKKTPIMLMLSLLSVASLAQTNDASAIKTAISDETKAFFNRQIDKVATYYVHDIYTSHQYNNPDGSVAVSNGWEAIHNGMKAYYKANPKMGLVNVERTNWILNPLSPGWYWVRFNQTMTDSNHKVWKSNETRLMKRINGQWKISSMIALFDVKK
jgi:hypothetical protein